MVDARKNVEAVAAPITKEKQMAGTWASGREFFRWRDDLTGI